MGESISVVHVLGTTGGPAAGAILGIVAATRDGGDHAAVLTCGDATPPDIGDVETLDGTAGLARFDLVELHDVTDPSAPAVLAAAREHGVPVVVHPHDALASDDPLPDTAVALLRDADAVWLTTRRDEARLARFGDGFRTVLSALPVPPTEHHGDRVGFRERHDLDHEHRVLLHHGPLAPGQGLERLVDAFTEAADHEHEASLVIAGSGDAAYEAELHERIGASRHAGSIRTIGDLHGEEKADALHSADLFVLHTDTSTYGMAAAEAITHGTPVLFSDRVRISDEVVAVGGGEVVPAGDTTLLVERLTFLLTDEIAVRRLCAGTGIAAAAYQPKRVAHRDAVLRRELLASP